MIKRLSATLLGVVLIVSCSPVTRIPDTESSIPVSTLTSTSTATLLLSTATPGPLAQVILPEFELEGPAWIDQYDVAPGVYLSIQGVCAFDKRTALLYGSLWAMPPDINQSLILRTADGGQTWAEVMDPFPDGAVIMMSVIRSGMGWAMIITGREDIQAIYIYRTEDQGRTWEKVSDNVPRAEWYAFPADMEFTDSLHGRINMWYQDGAPGTDRVAFITTSDGGFTWRETGSYILGLSDLQRNTPTAASASAQATRDASFTHKDLDVSIGEDGYIWRIRDETLSSHILFIEQSSPISHTWEIVSQIAYHYKYRIGPTTMP